MVTLFRSLMTVFLAIHTSFNFAMSHNSAEFVGRLVQACAIAILAILVFVLYHMIRDHTS